MNNNFRGADNSHHGILDSIRSCLHRSHRGGARMMCSVHRTCVHLSRRLRFAVDTSNPSDMGVNQFEPLRENTMYVAVGGLHRGSHFG
eukprot:481546-Amphidinium_carterae.2